MKVFQVEQGTPEWLALRCGIPTASELDSLVSPTGKIRTGEGPNTFLCRKLAERWLGGPLQTFSGGAMEQGSILEEEAIPWLEIAVESELNRVGFLTTDDGCFGCSPDGLGASLGLPTGFEIKCPEPTNHVKWLREGECPPEHLLQCQGGMYVTGYSEWQFVSYHRQFPKLIAVVKRDEKFMQAISEALVDFGIKMDAACKLLVEKNGGEPKQNR